MTRTDLPGHAIETKGAGPYRSLDRDGETRVIRRLLWRAHFGITQQ